MNFRNMMISDLFPSSAVYCDFEAIKKLEGGLESPPGCLTWLSEAPGVVNGMDKSIRKAFDIQEDFKMVFRLYKPPGPDSTEPVLTKPPRRMAQRVVISTIAESPCVNLGKGNRQGFKMKAGEAYAIPHPINSMITLEFDNNRTLIIPARKGFRQQRRTKRVEKRYIMVFDYIYTDDIHKAVGELIS